MNLLLSKLIQLKKLKYSNILKELLSAAAAGRIWLPLKLFQPNRNDYKLKLNLKF